jgi:ech hydrogenase subunit F
MAFFQMIKTVLNTVVHRPATLMYPVRPAKRMAISRGHIVFDGSKCISCKICMKRCPAEALCVDKEARTWSIDRFRCVVCNSCVETCPVKCLSMDPAYFGPLSSRPGVETHQVTYVKPERPVLKKDESGTSPQ